MLDPLDTWSNKLKDLQPNDVAIIALNNFTAAIGELMNKVQPQVAPPFIYSGQIFTFNSAIMTTQLLTLLPTQGPDWIDKMVNAWLMACQASAITPSTVTNATIWTASTTDVNTLSSAAATIPTISVGAAILKAGLLASSIDLSDADASRRKFADAFRSATLAFSFTLIGLAAATPSPIPVPIVLPAA